MSEEEVLGALPILSAALYIRLREHRPGPRIVPAVVLAAQTTDPCNGGSFNLQYGLAVFLAVYATNRPSACAMCVTCTPKRLPAR